jgi:hypothetical protein
MVDGCPVACLARGLRLCGLVIHRIDADSRERLFEDCVFGIALAMTVAIA